MTDKGEILLIVCDGRGMLGSPGMTLSELATTFIKHGAVKAMNLDGGGSTGMWVNGSGMINYMDGSWRAVKSTLGFFSK